MKKKVLLTAIGCPGAPSIIKLLKNYYDLYGIDCDKDAVGFKMIDGEQVVHSSLCSTYLLQVMSIIINKEIDFVLPMSTNEVYVLSHSKKIFESGSKVKLLVSSSDSIMNSINKIMLYKFFENEDFIPAHKSVFDKERIHEAINHIRGRSELVFVKPAKSNGSRGLYVLYPLNVPISFKEKIKSYCEFTVDFFKDNVFNTMIKDVDGLLFSEFLNGPEWSVDVVRKKEPYFFIAITRIRSETRAGICTRGKIEYNKELIEITKKICDRLDLEYCNNLQFIQTKRGFKLIEVNPRVSGTIVLSSQIYNLPHWALFCAEGNSEYLGPYNNDDWSKYHYHENMIRYYEEIFY